MFIEIGMYSVPSSVCTISGEPASAHSVAHLRLNVRASALGLSMAHAMSRSKPRTVTRGGAGGSSGAEVALGLLAEAPVVLFAPPGFAAFDSGGAARWAALTHYTEDGRIEIDNNAAERAIRALVLGRRNYLFAGSDAGGETAARLYSLIGTCRLNDIDPHLYLRYVLERIAEHSINRIDELLPWRVEGPLPSVLSQAA